MYMSYKPTVFFFGGGGEGGIQKTDKMIHKAFRTHDTL